MGVIVEISIEVRNRSWLEDVMFEGDVPGWLSLPNGATLTLTSVQPVRSSPEGALLQFLLENVVPGVGSAMVAQYLYEKLNRRRRDVRSVKVNQRAEISEKLPEEIVVVLTQELTIEDR
jgi:hypothetical protein